MSFPINNFFSSPELTLDKSNDFPPTFQNKDKCAVLGERKFHLNKSKTKYVSVGISYDYKYESCVKLSGNKCNTIIFNAEDWKQFLSYQGVITDYIYSNDTTNPIDTGKFSIQFEELPYCRSVKVVKNNSYIYLGYESICKLWEYIPLLEYRLNILQRLQFPNYFKIVQKGLQAQDGDIFENALNLLQPSENPNSENICMIMELIYVYPEIFEIECSNKIRL